LALLGLPDDGRTDFTPVNVSQAVVWGGLPGARRWLQRHLGPLYRPARALAHAVGLHPFELLKKMNRRAWHRPLRPEFERELIAEFMPQIEKVERLLGRDLAAWKMPRGGQVAHHTDASGSLARQTR
jgi:hypothetical protein